MQIETLMSRMGLLLARIAVPANFHLTSDPNTFNDTVTSWLSDPNFVLPDGSIVGLCCSSLLSLQFQEDTLGDDGLVTELRRFLLASSLAHSGWRGNRGELRNSDLSTVGHVSGYRLIKRLDRTLTPQFLAKCDRESCQVLFLLVLGAVLGIGYSSSFPTEAPSTSPQLLGEEFQHSPTLWLAMKEHLCQMLAHHLIFLGSMLGIKLETGLEQRIIETAVNRWNKMESFVWTSAMRTSQEKEGYEAFTPAHLKKEMNPSPMYDGNPPFFEEPSPPHQSTDYLVPVSCPEVAQFHPSAVDHWAENPKSYLEMTDEPEDYYTPSTSTREWRNDQPRAFTEPLLRRDIPSHYGEGNETRRRTMWLVRPYDTGPEQGEVNVHARVRGGRQVNDVRFFV